MWKGRTERPRFLMARSLLEEFAAGCMERCVALERRDALELLRQGIEIPSVEWRAQAGISGVDF